MKKGLMGIIFVVAMVANGTLALSYMIRLHLSILGVGVGGLSSYGLVALVLLPRLKRILRDQILCLKRRQYLLEVAIQLRKAGSE